MCSRERECLLTLWQRERLEEYAVAWKRWVEDPQASFAMMHGEALVSI